MNGIIGMIELMLGTKLDSEQRHYLKTVKSSADTLLAIVNDILDFSKIEAGRLEFEALPFNLADVVLESVRLQAIAAHQKGLEILVDLRPSLPVRVIGDPVRLRQVIANLVGNAIKFTERGEVVLTVDVLSLEGDRQTLRFVVRDTGIGIPENKQKEIFEAFSQGDPSMSRRFGGTGLGLAISSRLVEMMGGQISVVSEPGRGAEFSFTVRFGRDLSPLVGDVTKFSGRKALVVDDSQLAGRYLVEMLARQGVEAVHVLSVEQGGEALGNLVSGVFDYLFLDFSCNSEARDAFLRAWRGAFPQGRLVLLLTADVQRGEHADWRSLKAGAHLVKPFGELDLLEALAAGDTKAVVELDQVELPSLANAGEKPLRILLVEDNPINQELVVQLLRPYPHQVSLAANGVEALERMADSRFDVVFMDLQMPVMGGIEATEIIRAREMRHSWVVAEDFRQAYIVAMTANVLPADRERCLAAGMNDFVAKPISRDELLAALARARQAGKENHLLSDFSASETGGNRLDLGVAQKEIGDSRLLLSMVRMLLAEWPTYVGNLENAVAARDAQAARLAAHTLKGLLAVFHADVAKYQAAAIERLLMVGSVDWQACANYCQALLDEMKQLKPSLERYVEGLAIH